MDSDSIHMDFDSTILNHVPFHGSCSVARHKRVKRLECQPRIIKDIDLIETFPKNVRNHLIDRMDLGGENGRTISQAEQTSSII